jgi:hypothetical protein
VGLIKEGKVRGSLEKRRDLGLWLRKRKQSAIGQDLLERLSKNNDIGLKGAFWGSVFPR